MPIKSERAWWHEQDHDVEEECTYLGTSQMRKRSLTGTPVPKVKRGFQSSMTTTFSIIYDDERRRLDAHRAGCSADGGCSPEALWWHRTGGALADRRIGSLGKRGHPVRKWRFSDFSETSGNLAEGVAPGRFRLRPQRAARGDAG